MRNLVIILSFLSILIGGCDPRVSGEDVTFLGIENMKMESHPDQNHTLSYQVVLLNKSKKAVAFRLIGLETYANGLKIGELYCESELEIPAGDTLRYSCTNEFKTDNIVTYSNQVVNTNGLPGEVNLNFFGTVAIESNDIILDIPIVHSEFIQLKK